MAQTPCTLRSIPPMLDRRLPHGARVAAPLALLLTSCCSSPAAAEAPRPTTADGPDPAALAPAGAALYGEAVVRPGGDMEEDVVAAARKVFRVEDPGAELRRLLDESTGTARSLLARLEPWLGERVGGFLLMPRERHRTTPTGPSSTAIADRGAFDDALPRMRGRGPDPAGELPRRRATTSVTRRRRPVSARGRRLLRRRQPRAA